MKNKFRFNHLFFNALSCLGFFIFLLTTGSYAQLNGTYTIGTGAGTNYTTFTAAVSALSTSGVSGPVVFNVSPGTYNEQISVGSITGASSTNTITFQSVNGDSSGVILTCPSSTSSASNHVLYLNGADYLRFKQITIQRSGSNTYAGVILLGNNAQNNKFINNRIIGSASTTANLYQVLVYASNNSLSSNNEFSGNYLVNGSYGIYYFGNSSNNPDVGLTIHNNVFYNPFGAAVYAGYVNNLIANSNIINAVSTYSSFAGIYAFYSDESLRIVANKISLQSGKGLYVHNCDGNISGNGLMANNFITVGGSGLAQGINVSYATNQHIYYNNINITGTNTASGTAFYVDGLVSAGIEVLNNNFVNAGGGYAYYVTSSTNNPIDLSNYNNFFTTGTNLCYWKSTGSIANLSNWKSITSLDNNSISVNPGYHSTTDLHVTSPLINGAGTASLSSLTPVTNDIDGEPRSNPPDIGADEFSLDDLGVVKIVMASQQCKLSKDSVKVWIRNFSSYPFSGNISLFYRLNYKQAVNGTFSNASINGYDSVMYTFIIPLHFDSVGNFTMSAGTLNISDMNHNNDSVAGFPVLVNPAPNADAGADRQICLGQTTTLTAGGGISYVWNTGQQVQSITVSPTVNTVYYVTVANTYGCTQTDSVIVTVLNLPYPTAGFTYSTIPLALEVQFTNTSVNANHYQWDFGDGCSDTLANPKHLYPSSGTYNVKLIAQNQCKSDSTVQSISVVGMAETEGNTKFSVYPNPCRDIFYLDMNSFIYDLQYIRIYNSMGSLVNEIIFGIKNSINTHIIDLSGLPAGLYHYVINISDNKYSGNIILL